MICDGYHGWAEKEVYWTAGAGWISVLPVKKTNKQKQTNNIKEQTNKQTNKQKKEKEVDWTAAELDGYLSCQSGTLNEP